MYIYYAVGTVKHRPSNVSSSNLPRNNLAFGFGVGLALGEISEMPT